MTADELQLGLNQHLAGNLHEAERIYRQILNRDPVNSKAWHFLGVIALRTGHSDYAADYITRSIQLDPCDAEAHNNLGSALRHQRKLDEALASYRRASDLNPNYAEAYNNVGVVLQELGRFDEAILSYRRMLELKPNDPEAHYNLGNAFHEQARPHEAIAYYTRAIELRPDHIDAHLNRSSLFRQLGDFEQGWPEYEWRWKSDMAVPREFQQPLWDGSPPAGKTVLLHAEQGLGDTLQFVRYAPVVKALGATVILECQKPLKRLLESCPGVDVWVAHGESLPTFDMHAPLMSLPHILKTSIATIPFAVPYLFADPELVQYWRQRLSQLAGVKIGINWHGRLGNLASQRRNIPPEFFAPLARTPEVCLVNLQKEDREELSELKGAVFNPGDDVDDVHGPFMDSAAIMMNLDLIVTSDTVIPHLAGALGVPVWLALPLCCDWRWLLDRADSPWYPTMRLFRQKQPGDWAGVFEQIRTALQERLNSKS